MFASRTRSLIFSACRKKGEGLVRYGNGRYTFNLQTKSEAKHRAEMAKEFAVSYEDGCVVIQMRWGENRLNPDFISAMNSALDKAERLTTHTHTDTN